MVRPNPSERGDGLEWCVSRRSAATIDPRDEPAYGLAEAARYLKLPSATLRAWILGRRYPTAQGHSLFEPLIRPAQGKPPLLSFSNLVEAHVLRALRTEHGVPVPEVRKAIQFAEHSLGIERLLLRPELRSGAGRVLLEHYGELINLSASGQLAMKQVLEVHLKRIAWDERFPVRLHPFIATEMVSDRMPIAIDPRLSFGRPVLLSRGVSTAAIVDRIDAGEQITEIAADYELSVDEIQQAVVYERAA
jgi:uncharacterized protein (DUF433 family)